MGCLELSVNRIGQGLNVLASRIGKGLNVVANRIGEDIIVSVWNTKPSLVISCGIVCSVEQSEYYLRVSPDYVWLTPDMLSGEFEIYSNVDWEID